MSAAALNLKKEIYNRIAVVTIVQERRTLPDTGLIDYIRVMVSIRDGRLPIIDDNQGEVSIGDPQDEWSC